MAHFVTLDDGRRVGLQLGPAEAQLFVDLATVVRGALTAQRKELADLGPAVEHLVAMARAVATDGRLAGQSGTNLSGLPVKSTPTPHADDMLDLAAVVALTGRSERTIRRNAKRYGGSKVAGRWTFRRADVERGGW